MISVIATYNIILGILILFLIVSIYIIRNLLIKNERYEDTLAAYQNFISQFQRQVQESEKKLKEIDSKGLFDSDDEVGWFFTQLKEIQKNISEFKIEL